MADDKWISGLRGDMPVSVAAQRVLSVRLGVVRERLPLAVFHADDDIEHVHQLRVGARRAAAALRIFADCLPRRLYRKTRKALRTLRRSAGAARDWDVFLKQLQSRLAKAPANQRRGLDVLLGYALGQRVVAQEQLRQAHDAKAETFHRRVAQATEALESAEASPKRLIDLAVPTLTLLLGELESAAQGDLDHYDVLHQVRILGKQLRYAMEIFAGCFADEFRERYYPAVVEMQDILGLVNDSHVAAQRLRALKASLQQTQPKEWRRYQEGIAALIAFHERRFPEQRKKFAKWWRAWLKSGAETAFAELIRGN